MTEPPQLPKCPICQQPRGWYAPLICDRCIYSSIRDDEPDDVNDPSTWPDGYAPGRDFQPK